MNTPIRLLHVREDQRLSKVTAVTQPRLNTPEQARHFDGSRRENYENTVGTTAALVLRHLFEMERVQAVTVKRGIFTIYIGTEARNNEWFMLVSQVLDNLKESLHPKKWKLN